jgi:hypothetical protein
MFDLLDSLDGEAQVRWTIRLALLAYCLAIGLMLANERRWSLHLWTAGWLIYVVHVLLAFHHIHHYSHDAAMRHVEARSGFGPGIFASHLFTLLWTIDVLRRWRNADWPTWSKWVHGYMGFIVFNATVVYETGPIRWFGVAWFAALMGWIVWRWLRPRRGRMRNKGDSGTTATASV